GMRLPYDEAAVNAAVLDVVRENRLDGGYIRPLCFYGAEGMGLRADNLKVHVAVAAWPWGAYLGAESMERGIRVRTSSYTRHHVNVTMCRAKASGHYVNSMLALQEALRCGYDEALLLDAQGYATEGSGENLFLVRDGVLYTPSVTSALDGITRATVITLAEEAGYTVREKLITRDEVYIADEAFFTGTAAEVTPIRELDDRRIGSGTRGPVTAALQARFFDVVHGRVPEHAGWLTPVAAPLAQAAGA
ncbi:MAG TPA: branched-chain amino acid transaminase, partial [Gammaproteobacteria bacterium]